MKDKYEFCSKEARKQLRDMFKDEEMRLELLKKTAASFEKAYGLRFPVESQKGEPSMVISVCGENVYVTGKRIVAKAFSSINPTVGIQDVYSLALKKMGVSLEVPFEVIGRWDTVKDYIRGYVIHGKQTAVYQFLNGNPRRKISAQNYASYRIELPTDSEPLVIPVTKELLKIWRVKESDLYDIALKKPSQYMEVA